MKTLIFLLTLTTSFSTFASFNCTSTQWSPGLFGKHFVSSIPKTIKIEEGQLAGEIEGLEIASQNVSFGKVNYVLNAKVNCSEENQCLLSGTVTAILIGDRDNASGFLDTFRISIKNNGEALVPMQNNSALKMTCKL